jgi:LAO/AO transport system kinase
MVAAVRKGKLRAVARMITLVERDPADAETAVRALYADTGRAHVVGVTGSPGSGKSSLVNELAKALRRSPGSEDDAPRVGIVAVDPSSPFTGGALLGDRVRMRDLSGDAGIFIRSMASRGRLGGLAEATAAVVKVLDAAGFDVILVETVGAGQAEVDIAGTAHTVLVVEAPGMGDEIQSIKAGILEIADILVVNKADRPNKDSTVKALQLMLQLNPMGTRVSHHGAIMSVPDGGSPPADESRWRTHLLETVATDGTGVSELIAAIRRHRAHLLESGEWLARETDRSRHEIDHLLQDRFMAHLAAVVPETQREAMVAAVAARELDPYTAVARLAARVL